MKYLGIDHQNYFAFSMRNQFFSLSSSKFMIVIKFLWMMECFVALNHWFPHYHPRIFFVGWSWWRRAHFSSSSASPTTFGRTTAIKYGLHSSMIRQSIFFVLIALARSRATRILTQIHSWTSVRLWFDHVQPGRSVQRKWSTNKDHSSSPNTH